jgi:hypothetical protein
MAQFDIYWVTDPVTKEFEQCSVSGRDPYHASKIWASLFGLDEITRVTTRDDDRQILSFWIWPSLWYRFFDDEGDEQ